MLANEKKKNVIKAFKEVWSIDKAAIVLMLSLGIIHLMLSAYCIYCSRALFSLINSINSAQQNVVSFKAMAFFVASFITSLYSIVYKRFFVQFISITSFEKKVKQLLFLKAKRVSNEQLEKPNVDFYLRQATNASVNLYRLAEIVCSLIINVVSVITIGVYVSYLNGYFFVFLILSIIPTFIEKRVLTDLWKKMYSSMETLKTKREILDDAINTHASAKENKLNNGSYIINEKWNNNEKNIIEYDLSSDKKMLFWEMLLNPIKTIGDNGGLLISSVLLLQHKIDFGTFTAAIVAYSFLKSYFTGISDLIAQMNQFNFMVNPYFRFMEYEERGGKQKLYSDHYTVSLHNVSFVYGNSMSPAIKEIDLQIKSGERIAIVGENGAGKTTLSNIILGLYTPTKGDVTFNGCDLLSINEESIYANESLLKQDFNKYYNLTVEDNIVFGMKKNTDYGLIKSELGIDIISDQVLLGVEYGGRELSGGEWQKLACARCLNKDSTAVLLDEPTSAIDPLKEKTMYDVFNKHTGKQTVVIVTHRLGAIKYVDRIIVMHNGKIIGDGNHEELLLSCEQYKEMWEAQVKMYA